MEEKKTFWLLLECIVMFSLLGIAAVLIAGFYRRNSDKNTVQVPDYVFTYAENQAENYPTTQGAFRFAELVKEKTNGRIEIQVRYGAELGAEQSVLEQMQFGGIDFARVSLSQLAGIVPELNVLHLPFLYEDSDHMWRVLEGPIGDNFKNCFAETGLTALSWYDAGARNFYCTDKPIRCLEDMQGMVIRVQESRLMQDMIEELGGTGVQMPYDEVYSALQKKSIDGAENNWPSYESERHYEMAPYYTVDEHARVPELQLVSQRTWNQLSPEDQRIIRNCAEESALYERKIWKEREKESEQRVREAGCEVYEMPAKERNRFRERMQVIYEKYCSDEMDIIEAIIDEGRKN